MEASSDVAWLACYLHADHLLWLAILIRVF
jgi:hypothetical protein